MRTFAQGGQNIMGIQRLRSNGFGGIGLSLTQTKYKHMKTITFLFLLCFFSLPVFAQSDGLPRGAHLMPYTRYEATSTSLGGGATLLGPTFDQTKVQSEASRQHDRLADEPMH